MQDGIQVLNGYQLWGVALSDWLLAVGAALLSYVGISGVIGVLRARLARLAAGRGHRAAEMGAQVLAGSSQLLIALVALLIGVGMLDLAERWQDRLGQLWFVALALQIGLWGTRAIGLGVQRYLERSSGALAANVPLSASATLISLGLRALLWATVLLAMLANLGVNITAFVASLGIGGIAVALAVQNVLSDLFASLAIAVDKPFEVGDFLVVGAISGTVQKVGLKTTRIRALSGEQVVMSNADLLKQTINNYQTLIERRIVFGFGIGHDATAEQAEAVVSAVADIIRAESKTRFDRAHLARFGPGSLDFEVVYIVLDPAYGVYMDVQQRINLALMRRLRDIGVRFALPVRSVEATVVTTAKGATSAL